jgi:hypothetical protein
MDKFSDFFRAAVAVFHGIIATWLFLEFSQTTTDQFQFLLLLVCFTVVNVILWNLLVLACLRITSGPGTKIPLLTTDITKLSYRTVDVIGISCVAVFVSLTAAYLYRHDVVLTIANRVVDWRRTHSDSPFFLLLTNVSGQTMNHLDGRDPKLVTKAQGMAYLRVYQKDLKVSYEGFPRAAPTRLDPREFLLSPACRYFQDTSDPSKQPIVQRIEGPGVFVRVVDTAAFEVIDRNQSLCAKLVDSTN